MRLSISKPKVIFKEKDGVKLEPIERATVEVPEQYTQVQLLKSFHEEKVKCRSLDTSPEGITSNGIFHSNTWLMGYRNDFLTATRGLGILHRSLNTYAPFKGTIAGRRSRRNDFDVLGKVTGYARFRLQDRGILFVGPA